MKDKPPDAPYPKHTHSLISILHDHVVQWLHYLLTISCKTPLPTPTDKAPHA